MTIIEIVDDAGDVFSVMNIPIPFYIRCKLNEGLTKYRVRILDESQHVRGFYTGASKRDFLEVHVPVIPLQNYGKLFIYIELDNDMVNDQITHETSIAYVDQRTYESITGKTRTKSLGEEPKLREDSPQPIVQDTSHQLSYKEIKYLTLGEEDFTQVNPSENPANSSSLPSYEELSESEEISDSNAQSIELSPEELSYLTQRTEILQEDLSESSNSRILELSDVRGDEEE